MQTIYLDITNRGVVPVVYAKQMDVGRKIEVILTNSGLPYTPDAGTAFSAWYSGSSGEGNYTHIGDRYAFSTSGNKVVIELIAQMLSNPGGGNLCLVMSGAGGDQLGSWNIPYICEGIPGAGSKAAEQYYTAFSKAVETLAYPDASLSIPGNAADAAAVGTHVNDKNNPHGVTIAQIGAAPAGYGLGETKGRYCADCHAVTKGGLYYVDYNTTNKPNGVGGGSMLVQPIVTDNGTDIYIELKSGVKLFRCYYSSYAQEWQPWVEGSPYAFAPSGYGLGGKAETAPNNDANQITKCGFFRAYVNTPTGDWWTIQQEDLYGNGTHMIQKASCFAYTFVLRAERMVVDGKFYEWEWVNPPMALGVEYRTTERWNGKVVYTKLIDFGAMPNSTIKNVKHGINNIDYPLSASVTANSESWAFIVPTAYNVETDVVFSLNELIIKTTTDRSDYHAYFTVKYTKK